MSEVDHGKAMSTRPLMRSSPPAAPDWEAAMSEQKPLISPDQIAEWRKQHGRGMISAVGEYTPDAFWELLDAYEALLNARPVVTEEVSQRILSAIPANWCDPVLTGPDAVLSGYTYKPTDIERLLNAIRSRVTAALKEAT